MHGLAQQPEPDWREPPQGNHSRGRGPRTVFTPSWTGLGRDARMEGPAARRGQARGGRGH